MSSNNVNNNDKISTQELDAALNATSATNPLVSIHNQTYLTACIEYLESVLPYDELPGAIVHCSTSTENDASDAWGTQGGQFWSPPTPRPTTASPTTQRPSNAPSLSPSSSQSPTGSSPTYHPTLHDKLFVLRGTIYYDRNANGRRDADVQSDLSKDTEFEIGLGGVNLRLVECDLETNSAVEQQRKPGGGAGTNSNGSNGDKREEDNDDEDSNWNSYSQTISLGYDVLFHPTLADRGVDGGKYNMIDIKVNRAYFIQAEAPAGYLFTGGVCNNDIPGWKCPSTSIERDTPDAADSIKALQNDRVTYANNFMNGGENALGLRQGRSIRCVSVDRTGRVDGTLDLGVMKVGDVLLDHTEVRLSLDLANVENSLVNVTKKDVDQDQTQQQQQQKQQGQDGSQEGRQRSLMQSLLSVLSVQPSMDATLLLEERLLRHATHIGNGRYLLNEDDRYAIGVVAAEVLASSLDERLAKNMVELDHISPKEVVLTIAKETADNDNSGANAGESYVASNVHDKGEDSNRLLRNATTTTNTSNNNSNKRPVMNARNPTPRRTNRLTVDLEVWGHYPPQLNVDFDYIVQDSINRETEIIREELKEYNTNCDDQTEKVYDHGYLLNDFEEIHSNKGVTTNRKRKGQMDEEESEEQVSTEGGVFRTACSNDVKLPDYFEKSLEEIKVTTVGKAVILEEPSETPVLVIGLLVALLVVMVIGGFFIFRMAFKRKSENDDNIRNTNNDGQWTEYGSKVHSVGIQLQDKTDEEIKQQMKRIGSYDRSVISPPVRQSFFRRKVGNVSAALNAERRRITARLGAVQKRPSETGEQSYPYSQSHMNITQAIDRDEKSCIPLDRGTYDESICRPAGNSTFIPLNEDHVDAEERIKAFERRMMTMKAQIAQEKSSTIDEEDLCDESAVSSRPIVPTKIKFSSQYEKKSSANSFKSSVSSGSSSSSARKERHQKIPDKKNDSNNSKSKQRPHPGSRTISAKSPSRSLS